MNIELTVARKFRDEKRPRAGLLRGREFLMKDMYSFDLDESTALTTYDDVRDAYDWFFSSIGLPFVTVSTFSDPTEFRWMLGEGILEDHFVTSITMSPKVSR